MLTPPPLSEMTDKGAKEESRVRTGEGYGRAGKRRRSVCKQEAEIITITDCHELRTRTRSSFFLSASEESLHRPATFPFSLRRRHALTTNCSADGGWWCMVAREPVSETPPFSQVNYSAICSSSASASASSSSAVVNKSPLPLSR